ncbi:protein FAR-RED-ELONGATED HYPOCOTYL 1-LIKE isoform X2 [Phalaenopsis equestris]|uniref:protein FAR-RED-ELONGATED HYPOCOTYL 1-LIKE isoform X2 n=1 Tax=Phalaenopsis equestris TaxID=78828 RepID=UPI0009E51E93|nr:protein FAR-RED-ELONGATED HYPOCOTYL 1-LIKE isoform X2 [Phalaenopsis equestris]
MGTPPPSASSSEGHSISSVDLNKKRKLQDELDSQEISSSKQRFRVGTYIFGQGLQIRGGFSEKPIVREIHNEFEQPEESEKDSNTFTGAYDNSMSSNENFINSTIHQNRHSASLNSYSNEVLRTHFYSLESRGMKEANNLEIADLEDTLQFDPGYEVMEDVHYGFGFDHTISEAMDDAETVILYSNDVLLSSGRWNLGKGAPLVGARKLTIDQEFEQYFSSLLL